MNITIIYLVLGFLWIAFSDRIVESLVDDPAALTRIQTIKGWIYVAVTGLLLYLLIQRYSQNITRLRQGFVDTFDRYKALLEHANQIIIQVDGQHRFIYTNPVIEEILGYSEWELKDMDELEAIVHERDRARFKEIRGKLGELPEKQIKHQIRLRLKNGTHRWFLLIAADERRLKHVESRLLIIRDIHDETILYEQLNESNRRFEHLFQEAPVGFHSLDADMKIIDINKTELELLGYARDEVVGKMSWGDVIAPEDKDKFRRHQKELLETGNVENYTYTITCKDGRRRSVILNAKAFFDGNDRLLYTLGNILDITEIQRAEKERDEAYHRAVRAREEINKLNESLEEKVAQRTQELEAANKELESFAYSVSHDLRAPLRGIDGFSQALVEQYEAKLDEQGVRYLNRVRAATRKMGVLIDDILSLSRISRRKIKMKQVDLAAASREIFAALQEKEPDKQAQLSVPEELVVTGDPNLMYILMQNLLENAWKFSSQRSTIKMEIGVEWSKDQKVIYVRDNGVGFNMKYHDKLFMAFQRLHSQDEFPGTGIGLATVRRIIDRHSGTIRAESREGEGSIFYFKLPEKRV